MRVAVISDIHANLHALEAVREAIDHEAPDEIWCLGDLVGYGPRPDACCEWSARHTAVCLAGNHDLGVLGTLDIADFSDDAAAAAIWTRDVLSEAARTYLAALPSSGVRVEVNQHVPAGVHGLPPLRRRPKRHAGHAREVGLFLHAAGIGQHGPRAYQQAHELEVPERRSEDHAVERVEQAGVFQASPRDPVWVYVLTWEAAEAAIHDSGFAITLVGHSHVPLAIPDDPGRHGGHAPGGKEIQLDGARWLLNPGSVGQPRDGDPAAAWLLLDLDERRASFVRTEYDVERTQAEIRDRGLPDALAERLAHGV